MFYQPATSTVYLSHSDIRQALWTQSSVLFGDVIAADDLASVGVFALASAQPHVEEGQIATPRSIELVDGAWTQLWTVRDQTPEEIAAHRPLVPNEVTMRQARLALLTIGVLDQVTPAIEALEGMERETARIEWNYSSVVHRDSPLVMMMGAALGLGGDELDHLFITAAQL